MTLGSFASLVLSAVLLVTGCGSNRDWRKGPDGGPDSGPPDGGPDAFDPCRGVRCVEPPPPVCVDGDTVQESTGTGRCVAGACEWDTIDRDCTGTPPEPDCGELGVRTYTSGGACSDGACTFPYTETPCSAGCSLGRCLEVVPSNETTVGSLDPTTTLEVRADTGATFDTDADCSTGSLFGDCAPVAVAGGTSVCVCRMGRFDMGGGVEVSGARALTLLVTHDFVMRGFLDISGEGTRGGPGSVVGYSSRATGATQGAGGSHSFEGGALDPGRVEPTYGFATLIPLIGGMHGQSSCGAIGGGGGGALQVTAGESIEVSGRIEAGGGGGEGGDELETCSGGAGGGAGGAVLLEAPIVEVPGVVTVSGGGGGAAGGSGGAGLAGTDAYSTDPAPGGVSPSSGCGCTAFGFMSGGGGGDGQLRFFDPGPGEAAGSVTGCAAPCFFGEGGGGGGNGRIRVNSLDTSTSLGGAIIPEASRGPITTR